MERHERLRVGETSAKRLSTNGAQESSGMIQRLFKQHYGKMLRVARTILYDEQEIESMMDDLDQETDVDEAWQQFARQHIPSSVRPMHTWRKVAAILIGVLTLSGIAIAAVHIVQHYQSPKTFRFLSSIIAFFGKLPAN